MTVKEEQVIKKRKAQHALEEIFESEKKYVDKLNSIVEVRIENHKNDIYFISLYKNYVIL